VCRRFARLDASHPYTCYGLDTAEVTGAATPDHQADTTPPTRGSCAAPTLIDRVREGVAGPLTLLSAPAGFGKSTVLADALRESGRWCCLAVAGRCR
jgi:hypothetical protein